MFARRIGLGVFVALTLALLAAPSLADTLSPIAVTGFNGDGVYGPDGGVGGGYIDATAQYGGWYQWFAVGTTDIYNVVHNDGLPIGDFQSLTDSTHTYRLADAGANTQSLNVLALASNGTGSLTLSTPGKYNTIGVLACTTGGGSTGLSLVLHYAGGLTSSGLTYDAPDYGDVGTPANGAWNYSRAYGGNAGVDTFQYSNFKAFWLYETVVAADPNQVLESVTFTGAGADVRTHIFAVSGNAVPEPGAIVLLGTGLLGLLAYAWRKRR